MGKSLLGNRGVAAHIPAALMDETGTNEPPAADEPIPPTPGLRQDLAVLMKVNLNLFVLITTFFGFILASRGGISSG